MKVLTLIAILLSVTISSVKSQALKPEDFIGKIVFKSGDSAEFTYLSPGGYPNDNTNLSYTRDIYFNENRKVYLSEVSKIDIIDMTTMESDSANVHGWQSKCKVIFHDGKIWDNIFISSKYLYWKNSYEFGNAQSAINIIINLKNAKKCSKCSRQSKESIWKYCPYDGTELN